MNAAGEHIVVGRLRRRVAAARERRPVSSGNVRPLGIPPEFQRVFSEGIPEEDQTGVVLHHDLTPEAQAQLAHAEKVGEEVKRAIYILVGTIVGIVLLGGAIYLFKDDEEPPTKKRKKRKKRK